MKRAAARFLLLGAMALAGTGCLNHFVLHPRRPPAEVTAWEGQAVRGKLLIRYRGAAPAAPSPWEGGRLPAVLVHPEAGHTAAEMRGVVFDLARAGYLALAVDYRRERGGRYRETLFAWRDEADPQAALGLLLADPRVDPARVGLLGFSQGGVFSLLIAAYARQTRPAAVVAYYPVTDFESWMREPGSGAGRRLVFRIIRAGFRRASGAKDEGEFRALLARASPLRQAEKIRAPVLLVHGERDTSAPVAESERLAARLAELGREVELLRLPGAGHVFNFRDRALARRAWAPTLAFLDRHLRAVPGAPR